MRIIDLDPNDTHVVEQAASLLIEGFREHWPTAWPNMESALEEVRETFEEGRIRRVAVNDSGVVLGWIGGLSEYDGHTWELHPLVVDPKHQGRGIGRALVADFEEQVKGRGGATIMLGSDDEDNMTTIENIKGHPYTFYQKLGYVIVGVVPDANGPGKPDILMAKRVRNT
jgi:aminoglycoside 6'-N-acetyltransferase I